MAHAWEGPSHRAGCGSRSMDALQQQQQEEEEEEAPHRFIRPPPPPQSMSDPPPPPHLASWYPNQFQYQPSHSTWPPPPPYSTPHQPNTNSAPPPYPQHHNNPYLPSPPPPPQHMPPSYSQPNSHQTWGNPNWAHRQGWEHPDGINPNNHEEDWAARARAWAAAKAVMEGQHQHQHQQSHYTTFPARPVEKNHVYRDPYQHVIDPHYTDMQQSSVPALNQQQFSVSLGHPQWPPEIHLEESSSFTYGPSSSYASDEHAYSTRDGALPADPSQSYHYKGINETNSSVCQQEVPSSYSSVPGKEEIGDQNMHFRSRSPLLAPSAQEGKYHMQPGLSDPGRGFPGEQRHYAHGNQPAESVADLSDQPLEFAQGFHHEYDSHNQHSQASYTTTDPAGSVAPASFMTPPAVPGVAYPSMPTVPLSLQFDPSFVAPPIAGHAVPMFGQVPGLNFSPAIPTVGASFGLGMGTTLHPAAAFDANGVSNILECSKKASVPSWLREEIKKSIITSSSQERRDNPIEEDGDEKSFARGGIAGSKNIDSSRLSDDEDDDEDDEEAARTAAINQEIKRVLTDVLLKVTDELFDEIASKVLSEEDPAVEVDNSIAPQSHEISQSPTVPTPKASAKVLIPVKGKETEVDDASEKSSSGFPGDVLGLASYASDDEDELDSSSNGTTRLMRSTHPQPSNMVSEGIPDVAENGCSQAESGGTNRANSDNNEKRTRSSRASTNPTGSHKGFCKKLSDEDLNRGNIRIKEDSGGVFEAADTFSSKDVIGGKSLLKGESQQANVTKSMTDDSQSKESGRPEKHEDHDSKRCSADKDTIKQAEAGKLKADDKRTGSSEPKRDERHARKEKEKTHERNGSKDRVKDQGSRHGEKSRESDSRRSSSSKDDKIDAEKVRRGSVKDDINRKRDRERDEKEDRSRRRTSRDPSKHKRRRSPSVSPMAKSTKDNAGGSHANESSDQPSDDSRHRKLHSRKRSLSPSPSRSRRRYPSALGLASYASDDEDELDSSSNGTTRLMRSTHPQPSNMVSEGIPDVAENGCSQAESGGTNRANSDNNEKRTRSSRASTNPTGSHKGFCKKLSDEDLNRGNIRIKEDSGGVFEAADTFSSKDVIGGKSLLKGESQQANVTKSMTDDSQSKESGRPEKHEDHDSKRCSADKDTIKQAEAGKLKADDKRTGSSEPKRDERHARKEKEKTHERNGSKDRVKDQGSRHGEKSRESDSRRSSSSKDDKIDAEKVRRGSVKDDINRKRDRERDEKEDRSRRRTSRDPSKHKRRRSPSVSPMAKSTKDNAGGSHANESSDQPSDDSRHRKLHSRKRSLSPSPSRSRRRQVLRSSHSKHSQSKHSPYSSLENKRGRRSRSKSPARHRR